MVFRKHISFCGLSLLFLMLSLAGWMTRPAQGQIIDSPDAPPVSTAPATPAEPLSTRPVATLKVNADLVNFYFTAEGKHHQLIDDLTREDCSLDEDHVPQTITHWTVNANQPLTLGILLDTSGSQQNVLPLEKQSAEAFLQDVMRPQDQAFVLTFDVQVSLAQDFTNSIPLLDRALNAAQINTAGGGGSVGIPGLGQGPVPTVGAPRGTLLYDAVAAATADRLTQQTGRKALILLTDGEDEGSTTRPQQAIDDALRANTIIYVILIADRGFYGDLSFGYTGASQMQRLAEATGGRVINVGNNGAKLSAAFRQIAQELRTQYWVSYTPKNQNMNGAFRSVEIRCNRAGVKIHARKGYYATISAGN